MYSNSFFVIGETHSFWNWYRDYDIIFSLQISEAQIKKSDQPNNSDTIYRILNKIYQMAQYPLQFSICVSKSYWNKYFLFNILF